MSPVQCTMHNFLQCSPSFSKMELNILKKWASDWYIKTPNTVSIKGCKNQGCSNEILTVKQQNVTAKTLSSLPICTGTPLALHIKGPLTISTSCSTLFTGQEIELTDITLYPRLDRVRICLKNTSAVPLAGGKHTRGQRTLRGPASYINHSFSSELSTTI